MCPDFNLRVPPRVGANRHVCLTVLPAALLIYKMSETCDAFDFENDEDRVSEFVVCSCNVMTHLQSKLRFEN